MLLPTSREQINKLGVRLACGEAVSDADLRSLEELAACHQSALEMARPRLDGLAESAGTSPLHITHRAKTTQTTIEKLRRHGDMSLARMQDLAGIRVVGSLTWADQDRLADMIMLRFPADPRAPKLSDRRADPSHGYRALHVIVCLDGVTVEVQVRTLFQHVWADLMERLADRLGRQIRYGLPPVPPAGMRQDAAERIIDVMMVLSDRWAAQEPALPGDPLTYVDEITEQAWASLADLLEGGWG